MIIKTVISILVLWLSIALVCAESSSSSSAGTGSQRLLSIQQTTTAINTLRSLNAKSNHSSSWFSALARGSACVTLYVAEVFASQAAERELEIFRSGHSSHNINLFLKDSDATQELLAGEYYQQLVAYLVKQLAEWYQGKIPANDGLFMQAIPFRVFGGTDFLWEMSDGVDMADVIGSITYYARLTTKDNTITVELTNVMSLESYAGSNYFRHELVGNPIQGPFSSTYQVFRWQLTIPQEYQ